MTSPGTTYMDAASGPGAAFATVAALRYRAGTGRGQFVEFDQSENILNHLGDVFVDCQLGVEPRRWGNRDPWRAPQGLYALPGRGAVAGHLRGATTRHGARSPPSSAGRSSGSTPGSPTPRRAVSTTTTST